MKKTKGCLNILLSAILIMFCFNNVWADMNIGTPWTIFTSDPNHINFAYLQKTNSDRLLLGFSTGTHPTSETWQTLYSDDWGVTWQNMSPSIGTTTFGELPGSAPVVALGFSSWKSGTFTMKNWISYGYYNAEILRRYQCDITFPFEPNSCYFHRTLITSSNGILIATAYGKREGASNSECWLFKSNDYGKTWNFLSTAVQKESWMLGDGAPSEPVMVRLKNGNLLLVARNGNIGPPVPQPESEVPMVYVISYDDGLTWTQPVSLGTPGVGQDMVVIDDGRVVLSYGRPNVYIRVADATGTNWGSPILIYSGSGSGYTGLREDIDGNLLLAYNESDFAGWLEYSGTTNYMKMVKILVDKPCSGLGYKNVDINKDCLVNFNDFAIFAGQWLQY
jgi:hypothetical protein